MTQHDLSRLERHLTVYDFGLTDYEVIWKLQQQLVKERLADGMPDMLLMGEHPEVITTGRGTKEEDLVNPQVNVVEIERGGDATWHGPGQLIAYPILKLPTDDRDLHAYLRKLEEVLILTLRDFGIWGIRHKGYTGVWVLDQTAGSDTSEKVIRRPRKIASIGVAVKQWVTYHGIALNVAPDLTRFAQINPCGLPAAVMTSMTAQLGRPVSLEAVRQTFETRFQRVFGYTTGRKQTLSV